MNQSEPVEITRDIEYCVHDDVSLKLDLFQPAGLEGRHEPCVVMIHGGGMKGGSKEAYDSWGRYFAGLGYVGASISYRLVEDVTPAYPHNLHDVKAAIQYLRLRASDFGIDSERIALMGSSAGAYLAAMAILTRGDKEFANPYADAQASERDDVRIGVTMAGLYDLIASWEHDQMFRPMDHILEAYLGGNPMQVRRRYYEASPLFHADLQRLQDTKWLVVWGTHDNVVDPSTQSEVFAQHLKRGNAVLRVCPVPGASHYWYSESEVLEEGRDSAYVAPRIRSFLRKVAGWGSGFPY